MILLSRNIQHITVLFNYSKALENLTQHLLESRNFRLNLVNAFIPKNCDNTLTSIAFGKSA